MPRRRQTKAHPGAMRRSGTRTASHITDLGSTNGTRLNGLRSNLANCPTATASRSAPRSWSSARFGPTSRRSPCPPSSTASSRCCSSSSGGRCAGQSGVSRWTRPGGAGRNRPEGRRWGSRDAGRPISVVVSAEGQASHGPTDRQHRGGPRARMRPSGRGHLRLSQHARIFGKNGSWYVEDLGSTNGTFVNDQKLAAPAMVQPGDRIRVGTTVLELRR